MPWGGTRRGGSNSWLGNKPRGLLAKDSPGSGKGGGKGRGGASFFEGGAFEEAEEKDEWSNQQSYGRSPAKGKGRGGGSFFQGGAFEDAEEKDEWSNQQSYGRSPAKGKGRGGGSFFEGGAFEEAQEKDEWSNQQSYGRSPAKGKGRGGGSFFEGGYFQEAEEKDGWPQASPGRSPGRGRGRGGGSYFQDTSSYAEEAQVEELFSGTSRGGRGKGKGRSQPSFAAPERTTPPPPPEKRKVPGLEGALKASNLDEHIEAAHLWCEKQGAASLPEVVDFFGDFVEALQLRPLQRRNLWCIVGGSRPPPKEVAVPFKETPARASGRPAGAMSAAAKQAQEFLGEAMWAGDMATLSQAIAKAEEAGVSAADLAEARAVLAEEARPAATAKLQEALQSGDADALRKAMQLATEAGIEDADLEEARVALLELDKKRAVAEQEQAAAEQERAVAAPKRAAAKRGGRPAAAPPKMAETRVVAGMREAFVAADLEEHIVAAGRWCDEAGAAHIDEIIESFDEFAQALGLTRDPRIRLLAALKGEPVPRVPGLAEAVTAAGLRHRLAEAENWCEEAGAANLEEVEESIDDIEEALGLSPEEKAKLAEQLSAGGDDGSWPTPPPAVQDAGPQPEVREAPEASPCASAVEAEPKKQEEPEAAPPAPDEHIEGLAKALDAAGLSHRLSDASAWCDEAGAATLEEVAENLEDFAEGLGLAPNEQQQLQSVLEGGPAAQGGHAAQSAAPVAPAVEAEGRDFLDALADALEEAGMSQLAVDAARWCQEQGAANLAEVAEYFDDFADAFDLSPEDRTRLLPLLEARCH